MLLSSCMFGKSSPRSRLQNVRFSGGLLIAGGALFTTLSAASLLGARPNDFRWWMPFVGLVPICIGYAVRRVVRFVLKDPDFNNMFVPEEAELRAKVSRAIAQLDRGEGVPFDVEDLKRAGRERLRRQGTSS